MTKYGNQAEAAFAASATPKAACRQAEPDHETSSMAAEKKNADHYGNGCLIGRQRAQEWLANPKRGNPAYGGTLQTIILEYADLWRAARGKHELDHVSGLIVGFCYALECPADAARCLGLPASGSDDKEVQHG